MFKRKKLTLEEKIAKQRSKLRQGRILNLIKVILLCLGVSGGLSYLLSPTEEQTQNEDVIIESIATSYVRDYYDKTDSIIVDKVTLSTLSKEGNNYVVDLTFKLNDNFVATTVIIDSKSFQVLNELIITQAANLQEQPKINLELNTVKSLDKEQEESATKFAENYFSALNNNSATIFYLEAPELLGTSYDISTLKLLDGGFNAQNLVVINVSIDYLYLDQDGEQIYKEKQDIQIEYNPDSKIINEITY